jgi:flavin-binding protein dodecin
MRWLDRVWTAWASLLQRLPDGPGAGQCVVAGRRFATGAGKSGQSAYRDCRLCCERFFQENILGNHVYKHIELTGSSTKTIEDAVSTAIAKASKSLRNIHWFEVVETRGHVENGKVAHWQVTIKVGFTLED